MDEKYTTVGSQLYETMVFKIDGECSCGCGLPQPSEWSELDQDAYNKPLDATKGHYRMCTKWAKK